MHIIFILNIKEIHILTYLSVIRMNYDITISVPGLNFCKFVNDSQNWSSHIDSIARFVDLSHLWLIKKNSNSLNFLRYNPYTIKFSLLECTTQ